MLKSPLSIALSILALATTASAGVVATGPLFSLARPECREFAHYSTRPWNSPPDGFIVAKNGAVQFEYYAPEYGPDRPHALWSVTKSITGALLGIAVRDGKVSLDQKLAVFYPLAEKSTPAYESIRISNLFYSDTGLIWDEGTLDVTKNTALLTMFARGRVDMAGFVARRPIIEQGAGYRWRYNTGTPTLAMGVLRKSYGNKEYDELPWTELFTPLGMKSAVFEQDTAGNFVGGGYAFATPRDMMKLGQLYLQRGKWEGKTILPEEWIDRTLTVSPGYLAPGTTPEHISNSLNLVYGGLMWLNRHGRPELPKPFPKSPDDMFLALGRSGQFIAVIPSKNMVLVRTGRSGSIDDRIDGIVTRALACLDDPATPIGDSPPGPPAHQPPRPSLKKLFAIMKNGMRSGLAQGAVAKWVCSCHFVSGLSVDECLDRGDIPYASLLVDVRVNKNSIEVRPTNPAKIATGANFPRVASRNSVDPRLGCWLLP